MKLTGERAPRNVKYLVDQSDKNNNVITADIFEFLSVYI